ncbi:hypothetical protein ABBQ38_015299 [Trebouxia sp. C0009 RCD-2024]
MDRSFQPARKYPRRPAKSGLVDGFAEETAIYGGYNLSPVSTSPELASGLLRLLDNFTLYVQTDEEGSEELVDLQDFTPDGVNGLPLKATGTILDHRLCAQQSVYDARTTSRIKVRIHCIRDWVVDYAPPVTVWLITDWACPTAHKTELVAACLQLVNSNPSVSFNSLVHHLAQGVSMLAKEVDAEAEEELGYEAQAHAEVKQFSREDLETHAAFVVQQMTPVLGRHALKSFLTHLADQAGLNLAQYVGTGQKLLSGGYDLPAADIRRRPAPQKSFLVPPDSVPNLLLVWDFCQRYGALLRLPPFPFVRLQLACLNKPPPNPLASSSASPSPSQQNSRASPHLSPTSCKQCHATFPSAKALREHCSLSGHDPSKAPKPSKQKQSLAAVQPAVPLELTVQPVPDQVEMERWGATGQGKLLCDIHSALIRILEGLDEDLMEAPTMAGYGSATDLAPQDAYRPLLGASWPELARRYLQDQSVLTISQDAVQAALNLKAGHPTTQQPRVTEYHELSVRDRALILEALVTMVANTELLRNHLRHLEPEGVTLLPSRGAIMGRDAAGNIYHQLGGQSARGALYVESSEGKEWGWYSPQQIPSLIAWLETGSQMEQQLAEQIYAMYQPVLKVVMHPKQAAEVEDQAQKLWQPSPPAQPVVILPEALQQPRDGYKGSLPVIHPSKPLQQELLRLLLTAPFWNKDLEWLQSRAAVQALLPKTITGPAFARLLWLIEELLYEDLLKGSGWGRRRSWFRDQLEATRNVAQAAALGGQLVAHCRREADLGLVTPQELLQSAQRQRCYLGYIPQPPQDVVLFKSGYETHVRQQDRSVPPVPSWLESWEPMQDCKVKQMACVVEPLPASVRQSSLRSQNQPGFPPRVIELPCTAWLLLEKEPSLSHSVASAEEEIDWTHFTFQHGFRQLPQQLLQQLHHPVTSALPSAFPEVDVKMSEASQSPSPSPLGQFLGATQRSADLRSESDAASAPAATAPSLNIKDDPAQHARRDSPAELARHEEAEHGALKEEDVPEGEGEVGMAAEGEGLGGAGEEGSDGEIRQARPAQRPARLLNNALDDAGSLNLIEGEEKGLLPVVGPPPPAMLLGEHRIRFWRKERSLLAVALHVKPGMTRAAEFLVPVQLCNRALSVTWPQGMPVKMPFTGTVLDHLTKPRSDTRFCTGLLRQAFPAARPPVLPTLLGATPTTSPAAVPAAAAATVPPATVTTAGEASAAAGGTLTAAAAVKSETASVSPELSASATTAAASRLVAAQPTTAAQDSEAATQQHEAAMQRYTPGETAKDGGATPAVVKQESGTATAGESAKPEPATPAITAPTAQPGTDGAPATALKQEPGAGATAQQRPANPAAGLGLQAGTPSSGVAPYVSLVAAALAQQQQQQPPRTGAVPAAAAASQGAVAAAAPAGDPWNALDVVWDSDTPPGWPKLVCPWQVLEDRGGELRKAKERYRLVSLVATPPMMVGYRGGREVVGVEAVSMGQVLALYTRSTKCLEDTLLCGFVQPLIKAPVHLCILLGGARDAEKREKARQEAAAREAARRAAAERSQQAAAALQAERMRRALEARAVVAQVAEQKEAGRAAMAVSQGFEGASATGPQLLASVVPRPNAASAMANMGLPPTTGAPHADATHAAYAHQLPHAQVLVTCHHSNHFDLAVFTISQLANVTPLAVFFISGGAGLQQQGQFAAHALPQHQQPGLQARAVPTTAHQPPYGSYPHLGSTGLPMGSHQTPHSSAVLQVQAALADPSKLGHPAMPAQQAAGQQHEAQPGLAQGTGALLGAATGLHVPASTAAAWQHPAGGPGGLDPSAGGNADTPGSSPAQTDDSALHKRGRSADVDEQSSPRRAKKPKPAAEGYRERWLAGKPRAQSKTWCSMLCCVCEQGGDESELLICKGPCLRAFHPACLGLPQPADTSPAAQAAWFCPECVHGRVRCFVCGEFGAGFEDPTVRKCSLGVCGRFYHIKCAQSLQLTQMAKKGAHFRCPQHYCAVCQKSGDGVDMVKCIRCPTAYHSSCMPKDIQRLLPHAKVVLCSNHGDEAPQPYQHPPESSSTKLEIAQQQGLAMGLPPVKPKGNHGSGSSTDQRQPASHPAEELQGPSQAPPEPHLASGQPNQQPFHSQQHGLPGVTADPSLPPGTLPPQHPRAAAAQHLQHMDDVPQLASAPGLDPQSIPLALQDGPPQQPAQQHAVATPLAGPSLQGPQAGPTVAAQGAGPAQAQVQTPLAAPPHLQHSTQLQGHAGVHAKPLTSAHLSHPPSGLLSNAPSAALLSHSGGPLRQHESGQLHSQLPRQLPQAPSAALMSQDPSGQVSQHASGPLGHRASGQMSQSPPDHRAARQGSDPMTSGLLTHSLQGSQTALHLQAAEQAQQEQQQQPANGVSAVAETHTLAAMTQPVSANQAEFGGLPHQATGPAGQADIAYQHASAAVDGGFSPHASHLQSGLQQQQQPPQQLPNEQVLPHGSVSAVPPSGRAQQHMAGVHAPSGSTSDGVNVSNGMPGNEGDMPSPDVGLKLGQVHSPGLSEDALGGDQEFMDAMQSMAGGAP